MKVPRKNQDPFVVNAGFFKSGPDLYRDREDPAIRLRYAYHYREIDRGRQLLACLRAGQFVWPGGYECYFVTSDGAALSYEAVRENLLTVLWSIAHKCDGGWRVVGLDIADGGDEVRCAHTNRVIQEEYE